MGVETNKEKLYTGQQILFGSDFQGDIDNQRAMGSARRINPGADIRSVTSTLREFCITSGAVDLEALVADYPPAIFVWVVDPGVGTDRKGLLIETRDGSALIGPDNGLLLPAARVAGIDKIWELDRDLLKAPKFSIFDARDLFLPAAGHLSKGAHPSEIARPISEDKIVSLSFHPNQVVRIDGTGNIVLEHPCNGYRPGEVGFLIQRDEFQMVVPFVRSFDDVPRGDLGFLRGSIGDRLWLFRNEGHAADTLGIEVKHILNLSPIRSGLERAILQ